MDVKIKAEEYRAMGHLTLEQLLKQKNKYHKCIEKIGKIKAYPRPELHVSHISHTTDLKGLQGIQKDGAFKDPKNQDVVWFFLTVSPDDLTQAESRDMMLVHPWGAEQTLRAKQAQVPLPERGKLRDFAMSPAFRSKSRYGSYRFTFSLKDVLDKYKHQFCGGQEPVIKMYNTVLFRKEVMYTVLVSPNDQSNNMEELSNICEFRAEPEPRIIWRPRAMSGTHDFGLVNNYAGILSIETMTYEHYVYDIVALAFRVGDKMLQFGDDELKQNLTYCDKDDIPVREDIEYEPFVDAQIEVTKLWPEHQLQNFSQSHFHITDEWISFHKRWGKTAYK